MGLITVTSMLNVRIRMAPSTVIAIKDSLEMDSIAVS